MTVGGFAITQLYDDFFELQEPGVRCFLLIDTRRALLIDTGFGRGDIAAAVRAVTPLPVTVVHTHADPDHIGGTAAFQRVLLHRGDLPRFQSRVSTRSLTVTFLSDGDTLTAGKYRFQVLHLPGHTPGSIALLERQKRFLISGDTLQTEPVYLFGPGREPGRYLFSLQRLYHLAGSFDTVLPAHGSCPVSAGVLGDLIDCTQRYLSRELPPHQLPAGSPIGDKCRLYRWGSAALLGEIGGPPR